MTGHQTFWVLMVAIVAIAAVLAYGLYLHHYEMINAGQCIFKDGSTLICK